MIFVPTFGVVFCSVNFRLVNIVFLTDFLYHLKDIVALSSILKGYFICDNLS